MSRCDREVMIRQTVRAHGCCCRRVDVAGWCLREAEAESESRGRDVTERRVVRAEANTEIGSGVTCRNGNTMSDERSRIAQVPDVMAAVRMRRRPH